MPRGVKVSQTTKEKSTLKSSTTNSKKSTTTTKTSSNTTKKEAIKKDTFSFGSTTKPPVMSKEERRNIIEEALCAKPTNAKIDPWTVEDTEYTPKEWVVIIDTKGRIYEEPVPRYMEYGNFIAMITAIPDNPINSNGRMSINVDTIYRTNFNVKGVECQITSISYDGTRSINNFASIFGIKNGTKNIGGNLVFSNPNKGMDKKSADKVVKEIISIFEKGEELNIQE